MHEFIIVLLLLYIEVSFNFCVVLYCICYRDLVCYGKPYLPQTAIEGRCVTDKIFSREF